MVWFFSSVYPHMNFEMTSLWEGLVTMTALIWFLPSVCVSSDVSNVLTALIWFLPSVCVLRCFKCSDICEKALSHRLHLYGFSPVCILIWTLRWPVCEKALSQWLHWYGFSPVCVLRCFKWSDICEKVLSQYLHWCGKASTPWLYWWSSSLICVIFCIKISLSIAKATTHRLELSSLILSFPYIQSNLITHHHLVRYHVI